MKVTTERLPDSQVALVIEPDEHQVEEALRKAAKKIAQKYNIPGFRKGKAPYSAVVRAYGKEALYDQVVEELGDRAFKEALKQSGLQPIGPGVLEDVTFEPLVLRMTVPMPPEVDLGDYRSLRVDRPAVSVTDEDVQAQLEALQASHTEWKPVEDGIAGFGDLVTLKLVGRIEDDSIVDEEAFELVLQEQSEDFPPGFDAEFVGKLAGDAVSFDLVYPETWPSDRAGQQAHFESQIHTVKRQDVPPLDDDFAAMVSEYDTLETLKEHIRQELTERQQVELDNQYFDAVMKKVIDGAVQLEYPSIMLEDAVNQMVAERDRSLRRAGIALRDYLRLTNQSEEDFRRLATGPAELRLKADLVLGKLVVMEGLQASDEEVAERKQELLAEAGDTVDELRELFESPGGREALALEIQRRRAVERLMAIADGTAPSLEAVEAVEAVAEAS